MLGLRPFFQAKMGTGRMRPNRRPIIFNQQKWIGCSPILCPLKSDRYHRSFVGLTTGCMVLTKGRQPVVGFYSLDFILSVHKL